MKMPGHSKKVLFRSEKWRGVGKGEEKTSKLKCLCFFLEMFVETLLPLFILLFLDFFLENTDLKSTSHLLAFCIQAVSKHSSS